MNFFLKRYKELGQEIDPSKIEIKQSIRVNTLKISEKELVARLKANKVKLTRIPFLDHGYFVESEFSLGSSPEYLQGYYFIQEAASQIPVKVLDPKQEELVLDMAAAPGAKTTQIVQQMQNKGKIVALDIEFKRLHALKNNLERMGAKNCIAYQKDAKYAADLGVNFDKVLLDAPCSGNFAADKDWLVKRTIEGVKNKAKEQKKLIEAAINVLKKSGILVYSTCSLEPEENEEVVEFALDNFDIELEKIDIGIGNPGLTERTKLCRRLWPNKTGTQGFFVAKLRKR